MKTVITEHFLTTLDNPFNPYEDFDNWYFFDTDVRHQYHTCSYLERIAHSLFPNVPTTELNDEQFYMAMQEIVEFNPDLYTILDRDVEVERIDLIE